MTTITEAVNGHQLTQGHSCPPWCETSDHEQGELAHLYCSSVTLSLHSRSPRDNDTEHLDVTLATHPALCDPWVQLEFSEPSVHGGEKRLTITEAQALTEALQHLITLARTGA